MHQATCNESQPQTPRKQDHGEALLFLELLGKDPSTARFRFFAHKGNPRKWSKENPSGIGPKKALGFNGALFDRYQAEERGAYVAIGDGGDTNDAITSVPALFVEWDDKPLEWQRNAWLELGLPRPSLQVETGGKSLHTYWVLEKPLSPEQWWEATQRLIAHCGSDPQVSNASRVMRMPGFAYIGADGKPTGQTTIVSIADRQEVEGRNTCARYRLEEVLTNVPELPKQKASSAHRTTSRATSRGTSPTTSRATRPGRNRSLREVMEALASIPPILPGTGQRERFRALAWGLLWAVREAGGDDEQAEDLLTNHSPEVGDVGDYFLTEPHSITAASFWHMAEEAGWYPQRLLPKQRRADRVATAGSFLGQTCPLPPAEEARLVAVQAPMGCGKTVAIADAVQRHRAANRRAVVLTHRRSLGSTLAAQFDLAWHGDGSLSSDEKRDQLQLGMVLCTDSLCPSSGLRFDARAWSGSLVVLDEAAGVLLHTLITNQTTVSKRRVQVLQQLSQLLKGAAQVIVADAQLSEPVLQALEAVMGCDALLISSEHKPAQGRRCVVHSHVDQWRLALVQCCEQKQRVWVSTTSQKAHGPNSAQNLAELVQRNWPEAQVLVVDSETAANPDHPAHRLGEKPEAVLAAVDVVIASPAVAAGLSVVMPGHFHAVFGYSGGATDVASAVQALARVRDGCERHVYAAALSPGGALKIGSGSGEPQQLLEHLSHHEAMCVAQLLALGWEQGTSSVGPWLKLWGELASLQNRQRHDYRRAVLGLLRREGYRIVYGRETEQSISKEEKQQAKEISATLKEIATQKGLEVDQQVIDTPLITAEEAAELKAERRQLTAHERNKLTRWKVAEDWALGEKKPTVEVIEAHREGLHRRLQWGWLLLSKEGRSTAADADAREAMRVWSNAWAPDLCRNLQGPRLAAADLFRLPQWLERAERGEWFTADDPELARLGQTVAEHQITMVQVLGIETPATRPITELKRLVELAGYRLEKKRRRCGKGRKESATTYYRIVRQDLPIGADLAALEAQWSERARARLVYQPETVGACTRFLPIDRGHTQHTPAQPAMGGRGSQAVLTGSTW